MDYKTIYDDVYKNNKWYGESSNNSCPGVRLFPIYSKWFHHANTNSPAILDYGCGRGDTVKLLRSYGHKTDGVDIIDSKIHGMFEADLTKPITQFDHKKYDIALSIDVFEHIADNDLKGMLSNMKGSTIQIFSIHNGPSVVNNVDLHINVKPWDKWDSFLIKENQLEIIESHTVHPKQKLYVTKSA